MSMWDQDRPPRDPGAPTTEPDGPPRDPGADFADRLQRPSTNKRTTAGRLKGKLEQFFTGVAMAIATTGDFHCANIMADRAGPLAEAWANLADQNPRVRKMLEQFLSVGVYGEVVIATAATVIPIAAHHGLLPENMPMPLSFGVGADGDGSNGAGH